MHKTNDIIQGVLKLPEIRGDIFCNSCGQAIPTENLFMIQYLSPKKDATWENTVKIFCDKEICYKEYLLGDF